MITYFLVFTILVVGISALLMYLFFDESIIDPITRYEYELAESKIVFTRKFFWKKTFEVHVDELEHIEIALIQSYPSGASLALKNGSTQHLPVRWRRQYKKLADFVKEHRIPCVAEEAHHGGGIEVIYEGNGWKMKKAIIYDLDHTLFDSTTLDMGIFQPAFDTLNEAVNLDEEKWNTLKNDFFSISFNAFLEKHLSGETKEAFIQCLRQIDNLPKLDAYDDGSIVQQYETANYLVTSGLEEFQNRKIDALGIRDWFAEIYIDDPFDPKWKDKEEIFRHILSKHNYDPSDVLVVGDNPESEIKAGNRIGIKTIQILRAGVEASEMADHRINSLIELNQYVFEQTR